MYTECFFFVVMQHFHEYLLDVHFVDFEIKATSKKVLLCWMIKWKTTLLHAPGFHFVIELRSEAMRYCLSFKSQPTWNLYAFQSFSLQTRERERKRAGAHTRFNALNCDRYISFQVVFVGSTILSLVWVLIITFLVSKKEFIISIIFVKFICRQIPWYSFHSMNAFSCCCLFSRF